MKRATRTPGEMSDKDIQANSDKNVHPEMGKNLARQEFRDENDINRLMALRGIYPFAAAPIYDTDAAPDERNMDMGLQQQIQAARSRLVQLWTQLPPEVRKQFPDRQSVFDATQSGDLEKAITEHYAKPATAPLKTKVQELGEVLHTLIQEEAKKKPPATPVAN